MNSFLHNILNCFEGDNILVTDGTKYTKMYKFIHELIYDCHLEFYKPYAFVFSGADYNSVLNVARPHGIGESYAEVMANLQDKLVLISPYVVTASGDMVMSKDFTLNIELQPGPNSLTDDLLIAGSNHLAFGATKDGEMLYRPLSMLYKKPYLCRNITKEPITLKIYCERHTGIHHIHNRAHTLSENITDGFPCIANYSLYDFVRVCPPAEDSRIHLKFYNGMTVDIFKCLLKNMAEFLDAYDISPDAVNILTTITLQNDDYYSPLKQVTEKWPDNKLVYFNSLTATQRSSFMMNNRSDILDYYYKMNTTKRRELFEKFYSTKGKVAQEKVEALWWAMFNNILN